ncbi:hypothetical protein EUTSA_v10015955mg [Eutrema salsugineum]|uniref:Late embryogenesis abundant protein LEA-2 subgroup domain-containing protein n=2 Tax=Eutrema salsugineum TaxID=72664 RepID=V4LDV2_EUTSA|nr:hypothetical protein EUTSA_v10015955mg [Eutrema salsugineum]
MTTRDCSSHHSDASRRRKMIRRCGCPIFILFVMLIIFLIAFAILKPSKPRFILQDATVFSFNVSGNPPNLLTSNFQITLNSRNPNGKIGIYYDRLDAYASYQSQQITYATSIPATYQRHQEVNVWSPFVGGKSVPVAPYNALSLDQEQTRGAIKLVVHIDGRVRFKVGDYTTGTRHLYVRCPAYINSGNSAAGVSVGNSAVKYTLTSTCSVSV